MYYCWKHKNINPSVLYQMPRGELTVVKAFCEKEVEERNEMIRASEGKAVCPLWFR